MSDLLRPPWGTQIRLPRPPMLRPDRIRLIALEKRLSQCADKIALKSFAELLDALGRPKPRASRAMHRQQLLAFEVEVLCMRRLATGARKAGLRDYVIRDVGLRRHVSVRTIHTALARYGNEARDALRKRTR